jgi:hypothetical protein
MDVGSSQWWARASTMSLCHHLIVATLTQITKIWANFASVSVKGAPICLSTAYEGAKKLFIHPIWKWEAISGGL